MRKRSALLVIVAATLLALASSAIAGRATVNYPGINGCTAGCSVAAAGWPFPYIADYPGLPPGGSASLTQAVTGSDHMLWTSFVATWIAWAALCAVLAWMLRRRAPKKRRGL